MSPHRSNQRGTLMIDRRFPAPVGRLRKASGTTDAKVYRNLLTMLDTFHLQGRHDLLVAIKAGYLAPLVAFHHYRMSALDKIPTADVIRPLKVTWDAWVEAKASSVEHKRSIRITARAVAFQDEHFLNDLPALLAAYRATVAGGGRMFNLARQHAMAFVRDLLGANHRLWRAINDLQPIAKTTATKRGLLTPDEAKALVERLGEPFGRMAWSMLATSMGQKEYWGPWEELADRIWIGGTKRAGRNRSVVKWTAIVKPLKARQTFERRWREVVGERHVVRDLRRSFERWCEEAGIPKSHRDAYLGHGPRSMGDLYAMGELTGQYAQDAAKLRAFAGEAEPAKRLMVIA